MKKGTLALAPTMFAALACGGLPAGNGPDEPAAPPAATLQGRWCENDPEVGCYRFEGDVVHEEAVRTRRTRSAASQGTWRRDGDMLLLDFPEGPWTLQIQALSREVLVVVDHSQKETFTFTRTPAE